MAGDAEEIINKRSRASRAGLLQQMQLCTTGRLYCGNAAVHHRPADCKKTGIPDKGCLFSDMRVGFGSLLKRNNRSVIGVIDVLPDLVGF